MVTTYRTLQILMLFALAVSSAGCLANLTSIFRTFSIEDSESVSIDANQRVILTSKYVDSRGYEIVKACAEPSPDVFSVIGSSLAAKGSSGSSVSAEFVAALSQSGSTIGIRTQTIQLLRDSMYRLCEGYLSGALPSYKYSALQRRYQNVMLGLLSIEQLTGAVTPKPVSIKSTAPVTGAAQSLNDTQKALDEAKKDFDMKKAALDKATVELTVQEKALAPLKTATEEANKNAAAAPTDKELEKKKNEASTALAEQDVKYQRAKKASEDADKASMDAGKNLKTQESNRDMARERPANENTGTFVGSEMNGRSAIDKDTADVLGTRIREIVETITGHDYTAETCLDYQYELANAEWDLNSESLAREQHSGRSESLVSRPKSANQLNAGNDLLKFCRELLQKKIISDTLSTSSSLKGSTTAATSDPLQDLKVQYDKKILELRIEEIDREKAKLRPQSPPPTTELPK